MNANWKIESKKSHYSEKNITLHALDTVTSSYIENNKYASHFNNKDEIEGKSKRK